MIRKGQTNSFLMINRNISTLKECMFHNLVLQAVSRLRHGPVDGDGEGIRGVGIHNKEDGAGTIKQGGGTSPHGKDVAVGYVSASYLHKEG